MLALMLASMPAGAQDRGALTSSPAAASATANPVLYSASHALVIGIDAYKNAGWKRLHNAVGDAEDQSVAGRDARFVVERGGENRLDPHSWRRLLSRQSFDHAQRGEAASCGQVA